MAIFETVLKSDLKKPVQVKQLSGNLFSGDNQGNKITVEVMDNGSPASLSGDVKGYIIREDNITVEVDGTLSENKASIIFPQEAYNVVGKVCIAVKVDDITVGACTAYVYRTTTDSLIDSSDWIPSLAEIEAAAVGANKVANLTVSAEAATGSTPDAVLSETGTGSSAHKHITFKLVKGDKGNTGDIPQFSIGTISSLSHGATPTASIDNTDPEHPVLSLGIPAGASGNETIDDTAGLGDTDLVYSADKVRKELDTKAPVVDVPLTTPASVQSFPDGADNLPMAITVGVEPVQDLHGQSNPYPPGGGKNLWNGKFVTTAFYESDTWSSSYSCAGNYKMPITVGKKYVFSIDGTAQSIRYGFLDANEENIGSLANADVTVEAPANAVYLKWRSIDSVTATSKCQIEEGETATSYAPYSNICPISGWTGANVTRTGNNLFDKTGVVLSSSRYIHYAGGVGSSANYSAVETFLSCAHLRGKKISITPTNNTNSTPGCAFYTDMSLGGYISTVYKMKDYDGITVPDNANYMRFSIPAGYGLDDIQIELGEAQTAYEPYTGQTYPITFPSSAGTVYGGTVTVNKDGSGTILVTHKNLDLSSLTWQYNSTYSLWKASGISDIVQPSNDQNAKIISDTYKIMTATALDGDDIGCLAVSNNYTAWCNTGSTSVEPSGYVVYELASPTTVTLTAPQVKTLLGVNNLFADCGNITEVRYPADTKLYIDRRISELQSLILESL